MARNAQHQFVSTDTGAVISLLTAVWEKMNGRTLLPADPNMLFVRWIADVIIQERILENYAANQNIPSRASGDNLEGLAELFRIAARPEAQAAVCTERFHISAAQESAVLIPAGTRVTDTSGALVWETTADAYITIGAVFADVEIRCQTAGVIGNGYAAGQISRLVDVDSIVYYTGCENITVSDKGADRASDDEYYSLMRESQDAASTAGPTGAYVYHTKTVSTEIADVVANSPTPGVAAVYTLMKDGSAAGEEIKSAVFEACSPDDVRPLTELVTVRDPEKVNYDIDLTFYIPSDSQRSAAEIEAAVTAAVYDYIAWQCARFGRDINPDELRLRVKEAGVKRMVLDSPAFTVLKNGKEEGAPAPQIAAVGTVRVINGGHEDE